MVPGFSYEFPSSHIPWQAVFTGIHSSAATEADYYLTLREVRDVMSVKAWMLGPLVDALRPRCAYNNMEITSAPQTPGIIAGYNNMIAPLRLLQTRRKPAQMCQSNEQERLAHNFPLYENHLKFVEEAKSSRCNANDPRYLYSQDLRDMYSDALTPACGYTGATSKEAFGRGGEGFNYTELESGTEFDTKLCGKGFGSEVNPLTPKCYGPGGFVKDIWAADKYREGIEDLIENDWLDEYTESVTVIMQLANMQTSCLVFVYVLFEFSPSGLVETSFKIQPTCMPALAPKQNTAFPPRILDVTYVGTLDFIIIAITALYLGRIIFVNIRTLNNSLKKGKEGWTIDIAPFRSVGYWLDVVLLVAFVVWFVNQAIETLQINELFNELGRGALLSVETTRAAVFNDTVAVNRQLRRDRQAAGNNLEGITYTIPRIVTETTDYIGKTLDQIGTVQDLTVTDLDAQSSMQNAFFMSAFWNGTAWGLPEIDFRFPSSFVSMQFLWEYKMTTRVMRSTALLVCVFKTLRYFQAWRPLAARYVGLAQAGPQMLRFFVVLFHIHMAFSVTANLVFMFHVQEFESLQSSTYNLFLLLAGDVRVAQKLVLEDQTRGSAMGQFFVAAYVIIGVLTCSSVIISIIVDGWENSTEIIIKRRTQKRELKELDKVQKEAEEFESLKKQTAEANEEELEEMAGVHFEVAKSAEAEVGRRADPLHEYKSKSKRGKSGYFSAEGRKARKARREASKAAKRSTSAEKLISASAEPSGDLVLFAEDPSKAAFEAKQPKPLLPTLHPSTSGTDGSADEPEAYEAGSREYEGEEYEGGEDGGEGDARGRKDDDLVALMHQNDEKVKLSLTPRAQARSEAREPRLFGKQFVSTKCGVGNVMSEAAGFGAVIGDGLLGSAAVLARGATGVAVDLLDSGHADDIDSVAMHDAATLASRQKMVVDRQEIREQAANRACFERSRSQRTTISLERETSLHGSAMAYS